MIKGLIGFVVVALVVLFVKDHPDSAASIVKSTGSGLLSIGEGIGTFVADLARQS